MKVIKKDDMTFWEAETPAEAAAIQHVTTRVPLIAGCDTYGINCFTSGARWAMGQVCDKLPGLGLTDEGFEAVMELLRQHRA